MRVRIPAFRLIGLVVVLSASVVACQVKAPDNTGAPTPRPTQFSSFATTSSTTGFTPPAFTPIPTPFDPGRSGVDAQMDLLRKQEEAAQKRAQTMGLLSFLSCSLQRSSGKGGFEGILGCAGQGLQMMTLSGNMMPGYSSYSFMSSGGGMTSGGYTGGYMTGGYTTGGYGMTSGYTTGGYTTGGYRTTGNNRGYTTGYNSNDGWNQ